MSPTTMKHNKWGKEAITDLFERSQRPGVRRDVRTHGEHAGGFHARYGVHHAMDNRTVHSNRADFVLSWGPP